MAQQLHNIRSFERIQLQTLQNKVFALLGNVIFEIHEFRLEIGDKVSLIVEKAFPGQHFVNGAAETPNIRVFTVITAFKHFRGHMVDRPYIRPHFTLNFFGTAKIRQFHDPFTINQHIRPFNIPMDNILIMQITESFKDLISVIFNDRFLENPEFFQHQINRFESCEL